MRTKTVLTLLLTAILCGTMAQPMFYFRNLDVSDGLTSNFISSFCEDDLGFVWIGTQDGLVRYDGVSFESFYHHPEHENSVGSNHISWSITEDAKNRLWIALHTNGFSRYDPRTGDFETFSSVNGKLPGDWADHIKHFVFAENSITYLISALGILRMDSLDNITVMTELKADTALSHIGSLRTTGIYRNRWLWMTTTKGLACYDIEEDRWETRTDNPRNLAALKGNWSTHGGTYANGKLWFSTFLALKNSEHRYLYSFDIEKNLLDSVRVAPEIPRDNPYMGMLNTILLHSNGTLWMGTEGLGLLSYHPQKKKWRQYKGSTDWNGNLPPGPIRSLYEDRKGNIWIGTERGVSLMAPERQYFKNYSQVRDADGNTVGLAGINSLSVGPKDGIWLGKLSHGLLHLNADRQLVGHIPSVGSAENRYNNYIEPLLVLTDTLICHVWHKGLFRLNTRTGQTTEFVTVPKATDPELHGVYRSSKGEVFAWGWGRFGTLDIGTGDHHYISTPINRDGRPDYVTSATEDANGNIWIGMGQMGLACIDPIKMKIVHRWVRDPTLHPETSVWKLAHRDGSIYFSLSGNGLGVYNIQTKTTEVFSKKDGLCSDDINGVIVDAENEIWVYSSSGISWFDEANSRFRTFTEADGMISQQISDAALLSNGNMLMITDRGPVEFSPDELKEVGSEQPPSLRSIQVYDQTINIYDWLRDSTTITVPYNENYLRLEFSALEFFDPERIQFAYRLEGAEQRWNYTDHRPVAIYTNLRGGNYRLCVKRTNVDGIWGPELCVPVFVTTPFYRQAWFFPLMLLIVAISSFFVYRWQLRKKLAVLEVRNQLSRDLHDDIGSALSSINLYSTVAQRQLETDTTGTKRILERIGLSAGKMMQNMDDIIWTMDPGNDSVAQLVARMREFAAPILEAQEILLKMKAEEAVLTLKLGMVKRRNLFLIFKEAMNNMAKYSQASEAKIDVGKKGNMLVLHISDNGKGFDMKRKNNRHGLKNMQKRAQELNGKVEIISSEGKGTAITVKLPLT